MNEKMSLMVCIGRICSCAALLSCTACSREQDEDYQALGANLDEAVNQYVSENADSADQHDGIELGLQDYFAAGKLEKLSAFVTKRFWKELLEDSEAKERSKYPLELDEAHMLVSKDGVKWTCGAYSILPGCYGTTSVFIKWDELESFK